VDSAPSGEQFEIASGDQRATIVEVGGGIRTYTHGGRPVLHPYDRDAMCDGAHGTPLVPWPNRLEDGRYTFDGTEQQVALTEPDKRNAIHGFLQWRPWHAVEHEDDRVVMATRLHPRQGYPFALDVQVEYGLAASGLTVRTSATNVGDRTCPYGCGQHPYLSPGSALVDDCVLELPARTRILTDVERQLPIGTEPVDDTPFDFRSGRPVGELEVDFAFTDLSRDDEGLAWVRLTGTDGRRAELWVDETYPIIEIFTADTLAPERRRRGLGAEPMSCPPNAFRTGELVRNLRPGESVTASWGARLT
jgi:aldose 1-epimerase